MRKYPQKCVTQIRLTLATHRNRATYILMIDNSTYAIVGQDGILQAVAVKRQLSGQLDAHAAVESSKPAVCYSVAGMRQLEIS